MNYTMNIYKLGYPYDNEKSLEFKRLCRFIENFIVEMKSRL